MVIHRVRETHSDLHLLLDDTGCCGPSNVFLQDHAPFPIYESLGRVNGVTVSIHPTFARGGARIFVVDAYPSEADDSFSLETTLGHRLTLGFETAKSGEPGTSAEVD